MATERRTGFGHALRRLRLAAGLSQEELAERAGLSGRGISDLERGARAAPRPETVRLLADALGLAAEARADLVAAARPELADPRGGDGAPPVRPSAPERSPLEPAPLPEAPTRLVGRAAEVAALAALLGRDGARLVTLTGPGGVGKTRLALAVAGEVAPAFADGVAFVELAPVRDPALVAATVAGALGVRQVGDRPLAEALRTALRERRLLLVPDNFEHVLPAAPLVADLLAGCPGLAVLATSRERLHLRGEREVPVAPLAVEGAGFWGAEGQGEHAGAAPLPAPSGPPPERGDLLPPAVQLFVARAEEARPGFALDGDNAPVVAETVRRLDGLPLAIELAAAWVRVLPPAALLARLERRLPVLTDGPRDLPERQRTLRDTIAWSHDRLTPAEQALFRRLAVFVGGCTLDAAEAVGRGVEESRSRGEDLRDCATARLLDSVASLVDKHLLREADGSGGEPRYRMLETVREFGLERLAASGEEAAVRDRHAAWYVELAERADRDLLGLLVAAGWVRRLDAEHDNLRAALARLEESGAGDGLVRLAGAVWMFWYLRGAFGEGLRWLDAALAGGAAAPVPARARALLGAGMLAHYRGDDGRAVGSLEGALDLYRSQGDRFGTATALFLLGITAEDGGAYDRAAALLAEARPVFGEMGNATVEATACYHQGVVAWGQGDLDRAEARLAEALRLARSAGSALVIPWVHTCLGRVACARGDHVRAAASLREGLSLTWTGGDTHHLVTALASVGELAVDCHQAERAARLFGAQDALYGTLGYGNPGIAMRLPELAYYERAVAAARAALGEAAFAAAWEAGRRLPVDRAVAEGLALAGELAGLPSGTGEAGSPGERDAGG